MRCFLPGPGLYLWIKGPKKREGHTQAQYSPGPGFKSPTIGAFGVLELLIEAVN